MFDPDLVQTYDYELPAELIASEPAHERRASRLMVVGPGDELRHAGFVNFPELLRAGDLLVFNDVKVVRARLAARKSTGGAVELFVVDVLTPEGTDRWTRPAPDGRLVLHCMTRSSKPVRAGTVLTLASGGSVRVVEGDRGFARVEIESEMSADGFLAREGVIPLPPYIVKRRQEEGTEESTDEDAARYQTVYASSPGAVAAPTAGLHFDEAMLDHLRAAGVELATITLRVGPGTFKPVTAERLTDHEMHYEEYVIGETLGDAVRRTRERGGRVVAVGTTTVRTLEAEARREHPFEPGTRSTDLFIKPGFRFGVVDAMLTNFHLPRSTLLALVFAFGGVEELRAAYAAAVAERYRFYSYGDAMFIRRRE